MKFEVPLDKSYYIFKNVFPPLAVLQSDDPKHFAKVLSMAINGILF